MSGDILESPTLVLNRNWQPIHVTTVVRALVLLWNGSAKVVDPETFRLHDWDEWVEVQADPGGPAIRSAHARIKVPEVVGLTHYDRLPIAAVAFSRRNVAKRDHLTCQYCGDQPGWDGLTIDHIVPRSRGGGSTWTNCVAACASCNARKADRTPDQAGMRLRRKPFRPDWRPHYSARPDRFESWSRFLADRPELAHA